MAAFLAGLIFEPHPPNFENQYNFWRCLNGIVIIFLISLLVSDFQIFRDQCGVSIPFLKLVLWLIIILQTQNRKCKTNLLSNE